MHVYRFSLTVENIDDFYFEIDILPSQTFLDFHHIISEVLHFSGTELASFYLSNNLWKKKTEITLIDMNIYEDDLFEDKDDDENKPKKKKILLMDKTPLSNIIDDPHQRFIYVYDFLSPTTVYIEMKKIIDGDESLNYPLCSKKEGELPTKKAPPPPLPDEEDNNTPKGKATEIDDDDIDDTGDDVDDIDDNDNNDGIEPEDLAGGGFDDFKI